MKTVYADDYGFNQQDATLALQEAIDDPNADKIIVRDMDTPWLINKPIMLKSNKEIVFEEGVVVQAKSGSFLENRRGLFYGRDLENIKLIGQGVGENQATLKMNKEEYTQSEFGHVISLLGVKDYEVSGLTLTGGGGDGLHIAGGAYEVPDSNYRFYSENGLVENITVDNNRRSGISIDSAKNLVLRNATVSNNSGTAPSAGINLEPTWNFESLENIKIENVEIDGNGRNGIQMPLGNLDDNSNPISVDFNNISLKNSKNRAIAIGGKYLAQGKDYGSKYKGEPDHSLASAAINGTINFDNINISNSEAIAAGNASQNPDLYIFVESISGNQDDPNNLQVNFNNVDVRDPLDTPVITAPLYIQGLPGSDKPQEIGNISFNNFTVEGNYTREIVRAELGRPDANFNNISGDITVFGSDNTSSFFENEASAKNFDVTVTQGNGATPPTNNVVAQEAEPVAEEPAPEKDNSSAEQQPDPAVEEVEPTPDIPVAEEPAPETEDNSSAEQQPDPAVEEVEPTPDTPVAEEPTPDTGNNDLQLTDEIEDVELFPQSPPESPSTEAIEVEETPNLSPELGAVGDEAELSSTDSVSGSVNIVNSDFKDNLTGWVAWSDNISVENRTQGDEPKAPLRDRWIKLDAGEGGIGQDIAEQIVAGEDYQLKAEGQLSDLDTEAYVGVRFSTEANEPIDIPYTQITEDTVQEFQFDFSAPEEFAGAEVFVWKGNGSGAVMVDDFAVSSIKENSNPAIANNNEPTPSEAISGSVNIVNSDFQDNLSGWTAWSDNISVENPAEGDEPKAPLRDRQVKVGAGEGGIGQNITEQIVPGENYQLDAEGQLSDLNTEGYVGVRFSTEANEPIDIPSVQVTGNTTQDLQLDFTAPIQFASAEVFVWKGDGSGAVLVDDLNISST